MWYDRVSVLVKLYSKVTKNFAECLWYDTNCLSKIINFLAVVRGGGSEENFCVKGSNFNPNFLLSRSIFEKLLASVIPKFFAAASCKLHTAKTEFSGMCSKSLEHISGKTAMKLPERNAVYAVNSSIF